jgi:hypothetical protein
MMKDAESFVRWNVKLEIASRPRVGDRDHDSVRRLMPQEDDLETVHGPVGEFAIALGWAADGHDFFTSVAAQVAALPSDVCSNSSRAPSQRRAALSLRPAAKLKTCQRITWRYG